MSLAELQKFIAESKGEWEHIEFKKTTGELHGGMETRCGFLNGTGGKVLFGVTNAGKIQGQDMADAIRQIGVSEVTYYRWRQEFGGLKVEQVKRLKDLELENSRLRKAVSDLTLDKLILQEAARGNF